MKTLRTLMQPILGVVAIGALLSCSDARIPTGPAAGAPSGVTDLGGFANPFLNVNLLSCSAIAADSVSQSVDSTGGTINVGPHRLVIPSGALDTAVTITAIAPSDTINRVILYPSGLQFAKKVSLYMSYANCSPISILIPHRVAYVSSDLSLILDLLPSLDNLLAQEVRGKTDHFSDYVVAW